MTRHPLLTLLMAFVGIILVFPGVCALGFMIAGGLPRGPEMGSMLSIWAICLLISAGGASCSTRHSKSRRRPHRELLIAFDVLLFIIGVRPIRRALGL